PGLVDLGKRGDDAEAVPAMIDELNEDEQAMVELVRDFVNREVRPVVRDLEHANTYPDKLIEQMKQLGIYGLAIPEPWGDAQVSTPCYARITEELSRGWMSLAGAMGGHTVVAKLLLAYGTDEQKDAYLPRMATGELSFEDYRVPASALLGGREGEGFGQMMRGLEIGRIQVASRALGVGQAALDDSLRYAQQREAFGVAIWKHQSIGNYLADMVTKLTAAR